MVLQLYDQPIAETGTTSARTGAWSRTIDRSTSAETSNVTNCTPSTDSTAVTDTSSLELSTSTTFNDEPLNPFHLMVPAFNI